jgi:hypothetical protein
MSERAAEEQSSTDDVFRAACFLGGYWACLLERGLPVRKTLWPHLVVARDIVRREGNPGFLEIAAMVDQAVKLEHAALRKDGKNN